MLNLKVIGTTFSMYCNKTTIRLESTIAAHKSVHLRWNLFLPLGYLRNWIQSTESSNIACSGNRKSEKSTVPVNSFYPNKYPALENIR